MYGFQVTQKVACRDGLFLCIPLSRGHTALFVSSPHPTDDFVIPNWKLPLNSVLSASAFASTVWLVQAVILSGTSSELIPWELSPSLTSMRQYSRNHHHIMLLGETKTWDCRHVTDMKSRMRRSGKREKKNGDSQSRSPVDRPRKSISVNVSECLGGCPQRWQFFFKYLGLLRDLKIKLLT